MKGLNFRTVAIMSAIVRRGEGWIATGIGRGRPLQWSNSRRRVELRKSVEGLIRNAFGGPVLTHGSEVVIESTVFLGHENDVVDILQVSVGIAGHQTAAPDNNANQSGQYGQGCQAQGSSTVMPWSHGFVRYRFAPDEWRSEFAWSQMSLTGRTLASACAEAFNDMARSVLLIRVLRVSLIDLGEGLY